MVNSRRSFRFHSALVGDGWMDNPVVEVDADGLVSRIETGSQVEADEEFDAVALPGMINVHCHAFQRALAGLAEYSTGQQDSFWTWRQLMFEFLMELTPEEMVRIARQAYLEMRAAGYTWVGEFHYVHKDPEGRAYGRLEELSCAIVQAADEAGIGLCLLPTFYQRGGFDGRPLESGQRRFGLELNAFVNLVEACQMLAASRIHCRVGAAIHSLRAVSPNVGRQAIEFLIHSDPSMPIHIHVAEQLGEVEACLKAHARRPVEFLFDNYPVDDRWCLIHATHLTDDELQTIARMGCVVGLCPSTEANLGDGIFRTREFLKAGGKIAVGSDSNVSIDPREELRLIETTQRLVLHQRAVLGTNSQSVGRRLYEACARGGAAALGIPAGEIAIGKRCDLTLVDPNHPSIAGAEHDRLLDRLIFCNHNGSPIRGTVVGGSVRWCSGL